jgi:hypothetical protein
MPTPTGMVGRTIACAPELLFGGHGHEAPPAKSPAPHADWWSQLVEAEFKLLQQVRPELAGVTDVDESPKAGAVLSAPSGSETISPTRSADVPSISNDTWVPPLDADVDVPSDDTRAPPLDADAERSPSKLVAAFAR